MRYSLKHLAERTRFSFDECLQTAVEHKIPYIVTGRDAQIEQEALESFLDALQTKRPIGLYPLPSLLEEPGNDAWRQVLRDIYKSKNARPASLSPEQGQLLRALILNIAPKVIVEIGTFIGVSTLWAASALEEIGSGKIHCIDLYQPILPFPWSNMIYIANPAEYISKNFQKAGLEQYIELHAGNSHKIGQKYSENIGEKIDFLFIDGDHTIPGAVTDFSLYAPHVVPGGYVMLHDINPEYEMDGPREILNIIRKGNSGWQSCDIMTRPINLGIALLRKEI